MKVRAYHRPDGVLLEVTGSPVLLTVAEARSLAAQLEGRWGACPRCGRESREALVAQSCGGCGATWSNEGAREPARGGR